MHIQVFNMSRCFAMHMMSWQVLVFKTPGVLQRPRKGQEGDTRPHRRHPHPKGEWPEGVGHYRGLPRKEGGTIDDACGPAICDGA